MRADPTTAIYPARLGRCFIGIKRHLRESSAGVTPELQHRRLCMSIRLAIDCGVESDSPDGIFEECFAKDQPRLDWSTLQRCFPDIEMRDPLANVSAHQCERGQADALTLSESNRGMLDHTKMSLCMPPNVGKCSLEIGSKGNAPCQGTQPPGASELMDMTSP